MKRSISTKVGKGMAAFTNLRYLLRERRSLKLLYGIYGLCRAESLYARNARRLPTVPAAELFPDFAKASVNLINAASRPGSTSCYEAYVLSAIVQLLHPKILFEIGTFEGRTTLQLAINSMDEATIYTLDLPANMPETQFDRAYPGEDKRRHEPVGSLFRTYPQAVKIKQIFGDSATVHCDNLIGQVDFVFVDGDHGYEYVKADSENALAMLSSNGIVVWHDYDGSWDGVAYYLCELGVTKQLYHLEGTSLVIYRAGADAHRNCAD